MNNQTNIRPFCFLLAAVVFVFAVASTVNGQERTPYTGDTDQVIEIWDKPTLTTGEGLQGYLPDWFLLLKVETGHSGHFGSASFIGNSLVLTCHHNVRKVDQKNILLRMPDGHTFSDVSIVLTSPKLDLALLRVNGEIPRHNVLTVSNSNFKPDGPLASLGFDPSEDAICLYQGRVSDNSYGHPGVKGTVYQGHTAKVVQGMSGGPLLDWSNQLVGVNVAKSDEDSLATNLTRIQWFLDQYKGGDRE